MEVPVQTGAISSKTTESVVFVAGFRLVSTSPKTLHAFLMFGWNPKLKFAPWRIGPMFGRKETDFGLARCQLES